jgi:hypothetical protein
MYSSDVGHGVRSGELVAGPVLSFKSDVDSLDAANDKIDKMFQ